MKFDLNCMKCKIQKVIVHCKRFAINSADTIQRLSSNEGWTETKPDINFGDVGTRDKRLC